MSSEVAPARLGYRSPVLRVINGSVLVGIGGYVGLGILDRLGALGNHAVNVSKTASDATNLAFTYTINTDWSAYGAAWPLMPLFAVSVGLGVGALARNWRIALPAVLIVGGVATLVLGIVGLPLGAALPDVPQRQEQAWTSQYYNTTNELPDIYQLDVEQKTSSSRYENTVTKYYPTPFVLTDKAAKEHYFLLEPILNPEGDVAGEKIREVTEAQAQAAKKTYDDAVAAN